MAVIVEFCPRSGVGEYEATRHPSCVNTSRAEIIVFPRMSLAYLCDIAKAMQKDGPRSEAAQPPAV
jgi:hypothetical protein